MSSLHETSKQESEAKFLEGFRGGGIDSWNKVGTKYGIYNKYFPAPIL